MNQSADQPSTDEPASRAKKLAEEAGKAKESLFREAQLEGISDQALAFSSEYFIQQTYLRPISVLMQILLSVTIVLFFAVLLSPEALSDCKLTEKILINSAMIVLPLFGMGVGYYIGRREGARSKQAGELVLPLFADYYIGRRQSATSKAKKPSDSSTRPDRS